jgi:hypothetical protein
MVSRNQKPDEQTQSTIGTEKKEPGLTVPEVNELTVLLTKSLVSRQLEPEHAKRMGALRARAIETNLKIENHQCPKCKQPYATVEGTTILNCQNNNCRKK